MSINYTATISFNYTTLDRAATGTGLTINIVIVIFKAIRFPNLTLCKSGHGISVIVLVQSFYSLSV